MSVRMDDLITNEYRSMQQQLHQRPDGYGGKGFKWAETVLWVYRQFDCNSVLDYGCGRGSLRRELVMRGITCREYDPAIPGKDGRPDFADLVVCTDVLEHIEPQCLPFVLDHLRGLARRAVFVVICLREANKTLPDGRNAHLLVKPGEWWESQLRAHFEILDEPIPLPRKRDHEKLWPRVLRPLR